MESKLKVAICKNDKIFKHSESWTNVWAEYCKNNQIHYELIDGYRYDIIEKLKEFDILLWHPQNYVLVDMMEARSILNAAVKMGLEVFPDFNTAWHFDDKIAETYLLQTVNAPLPKSWVFYIEDACIEWLLNEARYPIIAKLRCGSGSNNVKMLETKSEAVRYTKRMFGRGYKAAPSLLYKAKSKAQSSHNWATVKSRIKRIPEFLHTLSRANKFPKERGYVYFQEFIPNDGYDLKVVVIGDKVSGFARNTRKGEFRASGGGDIRYENQLVTAEIRDSALAVNKAIKSQCMGFDYVVDKRTGKGFIVEMCFGFSNDALIQVGGYWHSDGKWHNEPLNASEEVLKNLLNLDRF